MTPKHVRAAIMQCVKQSLINKTQLYSIVTNKKKRKEEHNVLERRPRIVVIVWGKSKDLGNELRLMISSVSTFRCFGVSRLNDYFMDH